MALPQLPRAAWLSVAAVLLLGALVFLFLKTESASYKSEAHALALLRELKDADSRWDIEALRHANSLTPATPAARDFGGILARILHELSQDAVRSAAGPYIAGIRSGMAEKQALYGSLDAAHLQSLTALGTAREALASVISEAPRAKAREARSAESAMALAVHADRILAAMRGADIESPDELEREVEASLAILAAVGRLADPQLAQSAARAEEATRAFLTARKAEARAWSKFSFLTVGGRVDLAARELGARIEGALEEKDRWRIYLVAYAAALLVGVGYLVTRVLAAGAALRQANAELEKRVVERTADLSRALRSLKESEAQLVQTEKMSSLGQLVAGVAHEINTPLAYVKSNVASIRDHVPVLEAAIDCAGALLAMLQSQSADPERLRAAFAALEADLDRLRERKVLRDLDVFTHDGMHGIEQISELVGNLRNFSRVDRSRIASFNVNESVNAALLIARTLLRNVDVEKGLGEVPPITCSPSQVNQVVLNLLTNAVQAIDGRAGRITATTRTQGEDCVAIEIADNGRGIAPENMGRIFDPFFTTKEVGSGTGLGLSIACKIVAQHGGRIDVRSTPGEGSTFTVILPIKPPHEIGEGSQAPEAVSA
jgi:two-component system, NtrC family, sensor kinase